MHIGICNLSVIPLRASNTHSSEMVSQVLFAEQFEICRQEKEWAYVRLLDTDYAGWIQLGQFVLLSEENVMDISENRYAVVGLSGATASIDNKVVNLIPGTRIPRQLLERQYSGIPYASFPYQISGVLRRPDVADFENVLPELIAYYHNSPYLWGGRTCYGIDCSGLSQIVYAYFGILLPRDAYQQVEKGEVVDFLSEIKAGDLAFFDNEEGRITHVGIMMDTETIFHASVSVRIDKMDSEGIFNKELNGYTHRLRIVKRFL